MDDDDDDDWGQIIFNRELRERRVVNPIIQREPSPPVVQDELPIINFHKVEKNYSHPIRPTSNYSYSKPNYNQPKSYQTSFVPKLKETSVKTNYKSAYRNEKSSINDVVKVSKMIENPLWNQQNNSVFNEIMNDTAESFAHSLIFPD